MQPFSEVPIKPDVSGTVEMPEANVDRPDETEGWKNSIELPDDTGEWVDSIELPEDSDGWQDSINLDSFDDAHRNGEGDNARVGQGNLHLRMHDGPRGAQQRIRQTQADKGRVNHGEKKRNHGHSSMQW